MLFPTIDFAVFFVIIFTGSWMLRPYPKPWRWFLLVGSCVFYLDPFNPIATEGQQVVHVNTVILAGLLAAGAATHLVSKVLLPERTAVPVAARVAGRSGAAEGGSGADGDAEWLDDVAREDGGSVDRGLDVEGRYGEWRDDAGAGGPDGGGTRVPIGAIVAPVLVVGGLAYANLAFEGAFPDRPDRAWRWLFLLVGVALANHTFARAVFAALGPTRERTATSRWLVRLAIVVDLAVLGYFKYTNFLFELPGLSTLADALGVKLPLDIILPIAISFFTFQAISYVVDVGRGELRPIPLLDFCVYLTFFAHVVAGPIVRVKEFAPQLVGRSDPRYVEYAEAFQLIFRGLFKKVVISSFLAANIVDPVFDQPAGHTSLQVLLAIYGFAIQIYADFSGYTDIAIGVALLLGIRFPQNFDAPYIATSLQDFWRRWHMTLSRWLRDYLYIPLGGNRKGEGRTYLNLVLTMVIGGLWHGASLSFLLWGGIHGGWLALERLVKPRWKPLGLPAPVVKALQWFLTFQVVCIAWVFFRTGTVKGGDTLWSGFERAMRVFGQLVSGGDGATLKVSLAVVAIVIVVSIASQFVPPRIPERITVAFAATAPIIQVVVVAAALVVIQVLGPEGIAPFIYFQF